MGYTIKQKIDICLMAESNPEMTQADLANWARDNYGASKPPSQTTISRILSKKNELIALKEHEFRLIRRRRLTNPLLRKVLEEWVAQSVWDGMPISAPIIQSSAVSLWKALPEKMREGNGEFSHKWCSHFFSKMNVNMNNIENELSKPNKIWTFDERYELRSFIEDLNYKHQDIFTIDDFFLCYSLPLDKFYSEENSFYGATVMFGCNVDGSEKLEPLIIGSYENMICFEGKPISKITRKYGINYKSNRKAWLTSTAFYDYLTVLDKRLSMIGRKILMLIDDSASHRIINIRLESITLIFTSSASGFLPMNWGIIEEFKILYRLTQYLACINTQRNSSDPQKTMDISQFNVSLITAFQWVKRAWDSVAPEKILSCWKYSGVLNNLPSLNSYTNTKKAFFKLSEIMEQLKVNETWDISSLLNLPREKKNKYYISSEEIIESCITDEWEPSIKTEGNSQLSLSMMNESTSTFNTNSNSSLPSSNPTISPNLNLGIGGSTSISQLEYNDELFQGSMFQDLNFDDNVQSDIRPTQQQTFPSTSSLFSDYRQLNLNEPVRSQPELDFDFSYNQNQDSSSQRREESQTMQNHFNQPQSTSSTGLTLASNNFNSSTNKIESNTDESALHVRKHNLANDELQSFKYQKLFPSQALSQLTDLNAGASDVLQSSSLMSLPLENSQPLFSKASMLGSSPNNLRYSARILNAVEKPLENQNSNFDNSLGRTISVSNVNVNNPAFNSVNNSRLILNPKRKIALLSAIINSTEQGDFKFSNDTVNELKRVLLDNILELKSNNNS